MYVTGLLYYWITCIRKTFQYTFLWGWSWNLFRWLISENTSMFVLCIMSSILNSCLQLWEMSTRQMMFQWTTCHCTPPSWHFLDKSINNYIHHKELMTGQCYHCHMSLTWWMYVLQTAHNSWILSWKSLQTHWTLCRFKGEVKFVLEHTDIKMCDFSNWDSKHAVFINRFCVLDPGVWEPRCLTFWSDKCSSSQGRGNSQTGRLEGGALWNGCTIAMSSSPRSCHPWIFCGWVVSYPCSYSLHAPVHSIWQSCDTN